MRAQEARRRRSAIVYHPAYSKPVMPEGHRFPMPVFREIYRRLLREG